MSSPPFGSWPPPQAPATYLASQIVNDSDLPGATVQEALDLLMPPYNAGSVLLETTTGATVQAIAAPPAGYVTMLTTAAVKNAGVAAGTPAIYFGSQPWQTQASLAAGAESGQMVSTLVGVTDQAISVQRIAGTSALMQWRLGYSHVPATEIVHSLLVLTTIYQTVPTMVPGAANTVARAWRAQSTPAPVSVAIFAAANFDNVAHQVDFRLTRGALVFEFQSGTQNSNTRGAVTFNTNLMTGDVLEAKAAQAINTAGSYVLYGVCDHVPRVI